MEPSKCPNVESLQLRVHWRVRMNKPPARLTGRDSNDPKCSNDLFMQIRLSIMSFDTWLLVGIVCGRIWIPLEVSNGNFSMEIFHWIPLHLVEIREMFYRDIRALTLWCWTFESCGKFQNFENFSTRSSGRISRRFKTRHSTETIAKRILGASEDHPMS